MIEERYLLENMDDNSYEICLICRKAYSLNHDCDCYQNCERDIQIDIKKMIRDIL